MSSSQKAALRRFLANRRAIFALAVLVVIGSLSLLAPWISPYSYSEQSLQDQYQPPSWKHIMGTDAKGRDLFTRVLYGGRISFAVGLTATFVSILIGVTYGAISGFFGGKLDNVMMRFVDILYGLPYMFLVILLMAYTGRSIVNLFLALGLVQWLTMARIVRGQVLSLKEKEFVLSARSLGATAPAILVRHIMPNLLGTVAVYATLTVPSVMLREAFLSFLGLGVQPPMCSWGSLASVGVEAINPVRSFWWLIVFPGAALTLTLLALNFLGDGLRDALDPRLRTETR